MGGGRVGGGSVGGGRVVVEVPAKPEPLEGGGLNNYLLGVTVRPRNLTRPLFTTIPKLNRLATPDGPPSCTPFTVPVHLGSQTPIATFTVAALVTKAKSQVQPRPLTVINSPSKTSS